MPLAKLKPRDYDLPTPLPALPFAAEAESMVAIDSPARRLQQRLEAQAHPEPQVERWPVARSAALIVATSLALWAAILEAGAQLLHAIA